MAENPQALYHVTFLKHVPSIARTGLSPGHPRSIGDETFDTHRKGAIFLTEGKGVPFWLLTAERWAEEWYGVDTGTLEREGVEEGIVPVVLRVKDPPQCESDTIGSRGASYPAYRCEQSLTPQDLEIWDGQAWVPLDTQNIDAYEAFKTIYVGAAFGIDDPKGEFDTFRFKRPRPLLPPEDRRLNPSTNTDLARRLKF